MNAVNKRTGFTLIELILVFVILAILTIVAITQIGPFRRVKLDGAANRLMLDIRYAQQAAINRQETCGVSFNPGNNSYFVYIGTTATKAKDPLSRDDLIVDYDTDTEYKGVTLSSTNFGNDISFDHLGTPYNSGGTALASAGNVVLQYDSFSETVTIEPSTGSVEI